MCVTPFCSDISAMATEISISEGPSSRPNNKWWCISIMKILTYLVIALTSDANSNKPSDEPSMASLERSGWGIIPSTL